VAQHPQRPPGGPAAQLGPYDAPRIGEAQRRFWLIVDAMLVALVVVALVGGWAYLQVRGSLRDVRSAGLMSLLEAEARALQLWIEEKKRDAERWASSPRVQGAGAAIAASAAAGTVCASAPQRAMQAEIAPFVALEEVTVFNLIARDGRIVSSPYPEYCGRHVSEAFLRRLAPVFDGQTVFVRPWREAERVAGWEAGATKETLTWVETPVRDGDGRIVAALGFGRIATQRFGRLLTLSSGGTSREAYAFDENAAMVTQSRYARELAASGAGGPDEWSVRDPGGNLLQGFRPSATSPLTALAAAALGHSESSQGVLLESYRNYRGAEVIGAWRWLPDERIAVAVEIEAREAYGALEYLQVAFGALFALVLLAMTAAASTSLWAVRVRMREAKRIGPYEIVREIGEGGMSHVYLARHTQLKRPAAVKVLKPHLATDEAVARFRREAQLCSRLSHPNTVEIHDFGCTRAGGWYYAMEHLRGVSIGELVRQEGPMPVARAVHMLLQACGSLEEAHEHGLVHRDVKPSNLMLCIRGGLHDVVKVVDFGLVKDTRSAHTRDITQYSRILGTPLYMAPERLRDPADADARADIYALGAVAYFAIVGSDAFHAESDHDIVYRVLNEPAPGTAHVAPAALAELIARCLEKDRALRPASMAEVRSVLEAISRDLPWTEAEARAWWAVKGATLGIPATDG
jgi:eukaryotic-like serine/threonine-protein kinase